MPFSAVTSTDNALAPTSREIAALALPELTADRLEPLPTRSVAFVSAVVAVSRACVVPFGTVAEYWVVAAENVPMSSADQLPSAPVSAVSPARSALADATRASRVTVTE